MQAQENKVREETKYKEMILSEEEIKMVTYIRKVDDPKIREALVNIFKFCAIQNLKK